MVRNAHDFTSGLHLYFSQTPLRYLLEGRLDELKHGLRLLNC